MIGLMVLHWGTVEGNTVIARGVGVPAASGTVKPTRTAAVMPPQRGMGRAKGVAGRGGSRGVKGSGRRG